jgi:hypothetical protein
MKRPHENCYWVIEGQFLAGEYPGSRDGEVAQDKIAKHLEVGLSYFLDLTEPGELEPYQTLLRSQTVPYNNEALYRRFPIHDASVPQNPTEMIALLDIIDEALADGHTLYLHCWGGVGRTGTVVGCHLVRHGLTGEEALHQISIWWRDMAKSSRVPRSPETSEQEAFIRGWRRGA